MNILIIGSGGREHAIAKKISSSKKVSNIFCVPGNPGISNYAKCFFDAKTDNDSLVDFAITNKIDLTIVGPEQFLFNGVVDAFKANKLTIFGPTKKSCLIETSKKYAKELMSRYMIPTTSYYEFDDYDEAVKYCNSLTIFPQVVKYNGLAAGKGVVICEDKEALDHTIYDMLFLKKFGDDGIIIEEFLDGEEFTILSLVNNNICVPLASAKDYKTISENNIGLNTGGMGAISPHPNLSESNYIEATKILTKVSAALVLEDSPFCGVLYGGLINTTDGVKVIEFNARFGDPETEVVLEKMNSDLVDSIMGLLDNQRITVENDDDFHVGVVLSSPGYPKEYEKNILLNNIDQSIIHMGTKLINDQLVNAGGRVLFVQSQSNTKQKAIQNTYEKVENLNTNLYFRKDIGK